MPTIGGPLPNPPKSEKKLAVTTPESQSKIKGVPPVKEASMMSPGPSDPTQAPPAQSSDPTQQSAPANSYMQAHQQFSQAQPPDPNTFLAMIWPHLTSHQKDLVKALLASPQGQQAMAQEEQGEPAEQSGGAPTPQ